MPVKRGNTQFSITLPNRVIEMMEQLVRLGLYGTNRGELARTLILSRIEQLAGQGLIKLTRHPPALPDL